jgi:hypothetical protein
MRPEGLGKLQTFIHFNGSRTRDLQVCNDILLGRGSVNSALKSRRFWGTYSIRKGSNEQEASRGSEFVPSYTVSFPRWQYSSVTAMGTPNLTRPIDHSSPHRVASPSH